MPHLKSLPLIAAAALSVSLLASCTLSKSPVFASALPSMTEAPAAVSIEASPAETTVTPDPTPSESVPPLTQEDILATLQTRFSEPELTIQNATEVDENLLLVEFWRQTYSQFVLCHIDTGVYEYLGEWDLALKNVVSPDYFIFERKGEFEEGAFYPFPYIVHCFRVGNSDEEYGNFETVREEECFELGRSVQAGSKESDKLAAITVGLDGFELLFNKADGDAGNGYEAAATYIPVTVTSYDEETVAFTVELRTCQLSEEIEKDTDIETADNGFMSSYTVTEADGNILITVTLRGQAAGYMISSGKVPDGDAADGSPIVTVRFVDKDYLNYKAAW